MVDSKLVIGTSGTQLIGELAYLGIPAILVPEKGQTEQELNAYLANDSYPNMATISSQNITHEKLDEFICRIRWIRHKTHRRWNSRSIYSSSKVDNTTQTLNNETNEL